MKYSLAFILLFFCVILNAQSYFFSFQEEEQNCTSTDTTYTGIENWQVFQTDNNLIGGTKSILCSEYSVVDRRLKLSEAEESKVIYIENIEPLGFEIAANTIYSFTNNIRTPEGLLCHCNVDCLEADICNEITIIVNGQLEGTEVRDTTTIVASLENGNNGLDIIRFQSCFVSPPYEDLTIEKISIAILPQVLNTESELEIFGFSFENLEEFNFYFEDATFINNVISNQFRLGVSYVVPPTFFTELQEELYFGHIKVLNPNLNDLSNTERFYYDIVPEDSTEQKIINIVNTPFSQLVIQNGAQLRGALVAVPDNDTLRHRLNVINDGADMCLPAFVEIIMSGEDEFRYKSGSIHFTNDLSCLQFSEKAKLVIDQGSQLHYGHNGIGLLSLRPGASIVIEDNASLYFDGELIMPDNNEAPTSITLQPTQALIFSPYSKIRTYQPQAKLTIYMEGGHLDISELRAEYLQYLDIIYPAENQLAVTNIIAYPNPVSQVFSLHIPEAIIGCTVSIYDTNGQLLLQTKLKNLVNKVDVSRLNNGLYYASFSTGEVVKFFVGDE